MHQWTGEWFPLFIIDNYTVFANFYVEGIAGGNVESAILREWVTLRLNFSLKGYLSRQYLWNFRWGKIILQHYGWKFHTKKLCSRRTLFEFDWNWILFLIAFWATLWGDLGVTYIAIPRWKARDWLPVRHNWTFFAIFYRWDVISGNLSKSAFFEGVGHFECKFQTEGDVAYQPLLASENYSDCPFVWYQNICSALFGFATKRTCVRQTDGRTDRITTPKTALT